MHIYSYLKSSLTKEDNFIAILPNSLYLYNVIKIDNISKDEITIYFKDKTVNIKGNNLTPCKCLNKELLIKGNIERVNLYEK